MNRKLSTLSALPFALLMLLFSTTSSAQMLMCENEVSMGTGQIDVSPTGADDTANIQCALEEAIRLGIPVVKLLQGAFSISRVEVEDFAGSLEGVSLNTTTVTIADGSVDCAQMISDGQAPAGFKFIRGNVRVARLALGSNLPCSGGPVELFVQIHFTGSPAAAICDSETGFGLVERAALSHFGGVGGSQVAAVASFSEGQVFGECNDTLLGTLKVNRNTISGHFYGVVPLVRGSGQVDINFNEFINCWISVFSLNANHLLTVQVNDFIKMENAQIDHLAILVRNEDEGPSQNRVTVFRNDFDLREGSSNLELTAIAVDSDSGVAVSVAVTNNRFSIDSPVADVVSLGNARGAQVANNNFTGEANSGIRVIEGSNGATITSNDLKTLFPDTAQIWLESASNGVLVARNQSQFITDNGNDNLLIENEKPLSVLTPMSRHSAREARHMQLAQNMSQARKQFGFSSADAGALSVVFANRKGRQLSQSEFPMFR